MPFADEYREVYEDVYQKVCTELGINCWRVDEISRPGSITRDIVEGILDADLLVADLTGRNANVFYELGIAHAAGNKTIMTAQSEADVPFDIANYRVLMYEQSISGAKKLKKKLNAAITELLAALDQTNNPLQEAISHRSSLLGGRKRAPLVKYVNIPDLPWQMREWLQKNNIVYADDVNAINLEELVNTDGIGKTALGKFLASVVENDLYDDAPELQRIIVEYGIRLTPDFLGRWGT